MTRHQAVRGGHRSRRPGLGAFAAGTGLALLVAACSTVEPGQDFNIADVVYDENYYYCVVEPMLLRNDIACGAGDPGKGDAAGGCHYNVSPYRLAGYTPLVGDSCGGSLVPGTSPPPEAQANYGASQAKMALDPDLAPLLNRPTGNAGHPRKIFAADSPEADIIRTWAENFSTQ